MNAKNEKSAMKALVTGLILGGLTLGSLATTGCDQLSAEQAASFKPAAQIVSQGHVDAAKPELRSGIKGNHNETFLSAEDAV